MISMDKTYRQRNGRKFIVGAIRTDGVYPDNAVIGLAEDMYGHMVAATRRIDGSHPQYCIGEPSQYDLIEVVPDVVRWANVYLGGVVRSAHESIGIANQHAAKARIAILKVTTKNGGVNGAEDVSVEVIPVGGP